MLNIVVFYELMREKEIRSIKDLSRKTKIPYTTLYYMLTGHDMYVGTLVELSKFFNVTVDYMINKSYRIVAYTEEGERIIESTSSLIEALVST